MSDLIHVCAIVTTAPSLEYVNMLAYFVCQLFICGAVTKNCTSCKMTHPNIWHCLFTRQLTTILRVGGLGVEDQTNGLPKVPVLLHVIYMQLVKKEG
jgi:hypothetical protein